MKNVPIASEVAADLVATNADVVLTNADVVSTNQDTIDTAADVVSTAADVVQTGIDKAATAADVVLTAADVVSAEADKVQTGLDRIATAADVVSTAADVVSTNADVVLTAADVATTANKLPLAGGVMTGTTTLKGITETEAGTANSTYTVSLVDGTIFEVTNATLCTVTVPATAAVGQSFTVISTVPAAWSGTILWSGGAAPTGGSGKSIYSFISNGSSWYGMRVGTGFA